MLFVYSRFAVHINKNSPCLIFHSLLKTMIDRKFTFKTNCSRSLSYLLKVSNVLVSNLLPYIETSPTKPMCLLSLQLRFFLYMRHRT